MDDSEEGRENEKNMCSVCVTRKINTCLNPCGHTFCLACVDKMNNKCGMCRASFISKIKMYIADDEDADDSDNESNNVNEAQDTIGGFDGFDLHQFTSIPVVTSVLSDFYSF